MYALSNGIIVSALSDFQRSCENADRKSYEAHWAVPLSIDLRGYFS